MNFAMRLLQEREYGLAGLILVFGVSVAFIDAGFLAGGNLRDLIIRCAPTAIVACGVMLVVITGEIDISVGSSMALLAALMGIMISETRMELSTWLGIPATLLLGALVGTCTGALVTWGKVPSIIVTLGLLTALRGLTTLIMGGNNIDGLPAGLGQMTKYGILGMPISVWTALVVIIVTGVIITRTALGRRLYAVGSSGYSAKLVGLNDVRLKLFAFAYTGFLTGLATVVDIPRLPKIEAGIGIGFELLVITCVVVGGVSISGGRGKLRGVLLAVLLMTMIRPALTFMDVGESGEKWTRAIQGMFILLAVTTDSIVQRRRQRRLHEL